VLDRWREALSAFAGWASSGSSVRHSPTDFDLVDLSQDAIDELDEEWDG
jgi:hypothetical protein